MIHYIAPVLVGRAEAWAPPGRQLSAPAGRRSQSKWSHSAGARPPATSDERALLAPDRRRRRRLWRRKSAPHGRPLCPSAAPYRFNVALPSSSLSSSRLAPALAKRGAELTSRGPIGARAGGPKTKELQRKCAQIDSKVRPAGSIGPLGAPCAWLTRTGALTSETIGRVGRLAKRKGGAAAAARLPAIESRGVLTPRARHWSKFGPV